MKKASGRRTDELRREYRRSDFGSLVRGKYVEKVRKATNVIVLEPQLAKAFPNDRAVNRALRQALRDRKSSNRSTTRLKHERRAG
jgi:hypothetical protein